MGVVDEIVAANERYADSFTKRSLSAAPARRVAVVTCMDARLDPAKALGLKVGDAHVIRNAGGVVSDDTLRSLLISHWLLGTEQAVVIGHTDCGLSKVTNEDVRARIAAGTGADASSIDFLVFTDLDEAVRKSVWRVRESKLFPPSFRATGFVYDVTSGRLRPVA